MSASEAMRQVQDLTNGLPTYTDPKTDAFGDYKGFGYLVSNDNLEFSTTYHTARPSPNQITVPDRRAWELSESHVLMLMESIRKNGLTTPISVRFDNLHKYTLISGAHRLEAIKRLRAEYLAEKGISPDDPKGTAQWANWNEIPAMVYGPKTPVSYLQTLEIVENLHRRQLTDAEKTALAASLQKKKLGRLVKVKVIAEESVKQAEVAEVVEDNRFAEKSAKRSEDGTVGKGNKIASKPVTQATVAEAAGVHRATVQDAFKTIEAVTGVKVDLNKPETIQDGLKKLDAVMVTAGEDDKIAEEVRGKIKVVEQKAKAKSRVTAGRTQSVIKEAEKRGRIDLVEEIKTSPDMKLAVVEAADEMGISVRKSCMIELHEPANRIAFKVFDTFGIEKAKEVIRELRSLVTAAESK